MVIDGTRWNPETLYPVSYWKNDTTITQGRGGEGGGIGLSVKCVSGLPWIGRPIEPQTLYCILGDPTSSSCAAVKCDLTLTVRCAVRAVSSWPRIRVTHGAVRLAGPIDLADAARPLCNCTASYVLYIRGTSLCARSGC